MGRRWKGEVIKVINHRFVQGSKEHEEYKDKQREYYWSKADEYRARARKRVSRKRERNRQWVINHLSDKKCEDCGIDDNRVLAFDHLDPKTKYANVADLVSRGASLAKLVDEVKKCRVLCHNCHMLHTIHQNGGYHGTVKPCSDEQFYEMFKDIGYD